MRSPSYKRNITPEKAQAMLAKMGINISTTEAASVLDFMYKHATLEVEHQSNKK